MASAQRLLFKAFEGAAAAEILDTGALLAETGGGLLIAGLATSETGVGLLAVPAGAFVGTIGLGVFSAGIAVTGDVFGLWDIGTVPPPCSGEGRPSQ